LKRMRERTPSEERSATGIRNVRRGLPLPSRRSLSNSCLSAAIRAAGEMGG
jgi:hypothetical protein